MRLAKANRSAAESRVALLRSQLEVQIRSLEIVLGRYPRGEELAPDQFPALPRAVPAGLPADLIYRRPDLIAAQKRLEAAHYELGAAKKLRYPQFRLTGSGGTSSSELSEVFDPDFSVWSLFGGMTAPVFQGGRIGANIDFASASLDQAAATYEQVWLDALREVETALSLTSVFNDLVATSNLTASESAEAERLAWEQYRRGLTPIITVLETQRRAFNSQTDRLVAQAQQWQNRIDLYLALGGDFQIESGNPN